MLIFKKISYKNFLSTGNVPNVIELNKHSSTLITGKNGFGKSTILDALTFVLFGKPFRNVNKPQLINSINQKNLLVEIDFDISGKSYTVKRGIKPNVFQIICDGKVLNEEADTRDYQKILEQQILKLNYKTFTQVVILGSATFIPFMQLPAQKRREIIEDILDIRVFSVMNGILKEKAAKLKDQINVLESDVSTVRIQIDSQNKLIGALQTSQDSILNSIHDKIKENDSIIADSTQIIAKCQSDNEELIKAKEKYSNVPTAIQQAVSMKVKFNTILSSYKKDMEFFNKNDTCPKCSQNINDNYKLEALSTLTNNITTQENKIIELSNVYDKLTQQMEKISKIDMEISNNNNIITGHNHTITLLNNTNDKLRNELKISNNHNINITEETDKLSNLNERFTTLSSGKTEMLEARQLHDVAFTLLKDTGIKTAIIHEYMPVINKLINKYLNSMDFYAQFELDDTFQEVIRSRNRDIFSYNSFSEGEKQKINLSVLFSWRQIAKMKNSISTNLLIMDEIMDSSVDSDSIELLGDILKEFTKNQNTNIFVISHRENVGSDMFDHTIKIEKKNEFSIIS